ncbi:MAG: hypothetical protein IPH53_07515 [Flavobacteriales bacterium]|nr:hypothetical protein [Flavobacteriales bacterium]
MGHATWLNDWWEYDPTTGTWTQRANLPGQGRAACGSFVIDDEVYVTVGSRDVTSTTATFLMELYKYSPTTDTWTVLAPFPAAGSVRSVQFQLWRRGLRGMRLWW